MRHRILIGPTGFSLVTPVSLVILLASTASAGEGPSTCKGAEVPIASATPSRTEGFEGKKVRFRFDLPKMGRPQNVVVVTSEVPKDLEERTYQSFLNFIFMGDYGDGAYIPRYGCEYDLVIR